MDDAISYWYVLILFYFFQFNSLYLVWYISKVLVHYIQWFKEQCSSTQLKPIYWFIY